jgi:hypothetical protein
LGAVFLFWFCKAVKRLKEPTQTMQQSDEKRTAQGENPQEKTTKRARRNRKQRKQRRASPPSFLSFFSFSLLFFVGFATGIAEENQKTTKAVSGEEVAFFPTSRHHFPFFFLFPAQVHKREKSFEEKFRNVLGVHRFFRFVCVFFWLLSSHHQRSQNRSERILPLGSTLKPREKENRMTRNNHTKHFRTFIKISVLFSYLVA